MSNPCTASACFCWSAGRNQPRPCSNEEIQKMMNAVDAQKEYKKITFTVTARDYKIIEYQPNYVVFSERCKKCGDHLIENAKYVECGGWSCNYIEVRK